MKDRLLNIEEVAISIGVSTKTIRTWYAFKRQNPDNEYAKILPECNRDNLQAPMYWNQRDIWALIEFKKKLPQGRNGVMGRITQKYVKKENNNGKKKSAEYYN